MKKVPLFGAGVAGKSFVVTRQRRLNCYYENRPDGDKTKIAIYGTPGLVLKFVIPGIVRGILGTQSSLYSVSSGSFYSLDPSGNTIYSSPITTNFGNVSMAVNPTQVLIVDGADGYIYSGGALTKIIASGFPSGATTCTFIGGYFVVEQPNSQKFWVSGVFDGTYWDALAFASASQYSDNILAVDSLGGNLIPFSERHIEFWQNVGATPEPFAPIIQATSEYGLAAKWSRSHVNNSICFLALNPQGSAQVCKIDGYAVNAISTPDIDNIISRFSVISDATSLSYVIDGHPIYQITFPTENRSFFYDCSTGVWSESQTGITTSYAQRHIGNFSTYYAGIGLITDYSNGNVYTISSSSYTDNGAIIPREVITRHVTSDFNEFTVDEVYIDMDTGIGLNSGQGYDPQISLSVSKDNGRLWLTERVINIGKMGEYKKRPISRMFGSARDFTLKIRMTDPVKFVITDGAIGVRERKQ